MHQIEFHPLAGRKLDVAFSGKTISLPSDVQCSIDEYWRNLKQSGATFTRGTIFSVKEVVSSQARVRVCVDQSDYAHYLYSRQADLINGYVCRNIHTSCLLVTSDGFLIFGVTNSHADSPSYIRLCGGGLDNHDVVRNAQRYMLDATHNMDQELFEELDLDYRYAAMITNRTACYVIEYGSPSRVCVGFVVHTPMVCETFVNHYRSFEARSFQHHVTPEFSNVIAVSLDDRSIHAFLSSQQPRDAHINAFVQRAYADGLLQKK